MNLAARLAPLQVQYVRPLADAAEQRAWVPSPLSRGLRRIDGTCRVKSASSPSAAAPAVKVHHPIISRLYAAQTVKADKLGLADRRRTMLASLSGRVIEIGAGSGTNFAYYPATVEEVVAFEPETYLRRLAEKAAANAPVATTVRDAPAEQLPAEDESFDAAVASLVLCSVTDPEKALAELFRVLRPGGELRFNEHVRSGSPRAARIQIAADRLGWPRVSGGCHLGRDTHALMLAAGFEVRSVDQYSFRIPPLDPPKPHLAGIARKPS